MPTATELREVIDGTQWLDTHEHLVPERDRIGREAHRFMDAGDRTEVVIPSDWTALIAHYGLDDLVAAGMPPTTAHGLLREQQDPLAKWTIAQPYFEAARNTGYLRAVDLTTEQLFGSRLAANTCEAIDAACRELRTAGYYARVLDAAGVERCQVHAIDAADDPCPDTWDERLDQDLSLYPLVTGHHTRAEALAGVEVAELRDYVDVIETCFERFGPRVVAVKCLWGYYRTLAVEQPDAQPNIAFRRLRKGVASEEERRRVEDYLFLHALDLAAEHDLPVKLHVGYLAGNNRYELVHLAHHVEDGVTLAQGRPQNRFVLMHMGWPYQEHMLAAAKHLRNVVVDLCWAWILAPWSTSDFVCRFLTTAPSTKLLCFGGDYMTVESIVGHAELARRGLQTALERLVQASWFSTDEALVAAPELMRGNAERVFRRAS